MEKNVRKSVYVSITESLCYVAEIQHKSTIRQFKKNPNPESNTINSMVFLIIN